MNNQDALTSLLVATHPARLEILNTLRKGDLALSTIRNVLVSNEIVRNHMPDDDEAVKHCIGFFLTDLQQHGLVKSEMRPVPYTITYTMTATGNYPDSNWNYMNLGTDNSQLFGWWQPPLQSGERWYWLTELGEHALNTIKMYLGLTKWFEEAK